MVILNQLVQEASTRALLLLISCVCRGGLASCKAVGDLSIGAVPLPAAERAVVRTLSLAVPGGVSRLRMPATPTLLESKRGADRDEFMHFTKLSQPYVARTKAVMLAESMLRNADAKAAVFDKGGEPLTVSDKLNAYNWDLTNWSCYEALDGVALGQVRSWLLFSTPMLGCCDGVLCWRGCRRTRKRCGTTPRLSPSMTRQRTR